MQEESDFDPVDYQYPTFRLLRTGVIDDIDNLMRTFGLTRERTIQLLNEVSRRQINGDMKRPERENSCFPLIKAQVKRVLGESGSCRTAAAKRSLADISAIKKRLFTDGVSLHDFFKDNPEEKKVWEELKKKLKGKTDST